MNTAQQRTPTYTLILTRRPSVKVDEDRSLKRKASGRDKNRKLRDKITLFSVK
jgi:hypothetical protein